MVKSGICKLYVRLGSEHSEKDNRALIQHLLVHDKIR